MSDLCTLKFVKVNNQFINNIKLADVKFVGKS